MEIFGVGSSEMFMIALVAVVLFGERLPEVARIVAKFSQRLRSAAREFQDALRIDP
ncbi:MAG: twin-arginine translocase TatA/TatE family subunit [Fimbriimonadaceae bacterium]|nr:twin-arginine translocase TatA/TatE family subunit [Fimbriimonadaceae bacterium]